MDINKTIAELRQEMAQIESCITELEHLQRVRSGKVTSLDGALVRRRGRKFMGQAEREQVSARMKRYWAGRRRAK